MIAEIILEACDATGRQVSEPFLQRKGPPPTFPIGRYVSQALTVECKTMRDVRDFLIGCKYISDKELFGKDDYWQLPEEFEKRKKGDCEDFALGTWRQLLNMAYDERFVSGSCGRYREGHAWIEYFQDGNCFCSSLDSAGIGDAIPRLSTFRYAPKLSVSWEGKTLKYFAHKRPVSRLGWRTPAPLVGKYLLFWTWFWLRNLHRLSQIAWKILRRRLFKRELWLQRKNREL